MEHEAIATCIYMFINCARYMYMFMPPLLLSFRDEEAKDDFASSRELFISAAKERKSMDQNCKSLVGILL